MSTPLWQLKDPLDAVIFDCDGTLSQVEGIDQLAKMNGVGSQVADLTRAAMTKTGLSTEICAQRLDLVKPTKDQVHVIVADYFDALTPDVFDVIQILLKLGKPIYILSAGVNPSVRLFGEKLGIQSENIFAVDLQFDQNGHYVDFDRQSVLTKKSGKKKLAEQIREKHPRLGFVGDGMNDIVAVDAVMRFVGYGGLAYRENIAKRSPFYITSPSLSPLLALWLTEEEQQALSGNDKKLFEKGMSRIEKEVIFGDSHGN